MSFENPNLQINSKEQEDELFEKSNKLKQRTRSFVEGLFDGENDPKKRFQGIQEMAGKRWDFIAKEHPQILEDIEKSCSLQDKNEFIDSIMSILSPVLEDKDFIEQYFRENNFLPLNEILEYGISGPVAHIHLSQDAKIGLRGFEEGLNILADIVEQHEEIQMITASSDLITGHESLVRKFGFHIDGLISKEDHKKYFPDKPIDTVTMSHMERQEFLARHKNKLKNSK